MGETKSTGCILPHVLFLVLDHVHGLCRVLYHDHGHDLDLFHHCLPFQMIQCVKSERYHWLIVS
jgi:hypothetical protein